MHHLLRLPSSEVKNNTIEAPKVAEKKIDEKGVPTNLPDDYDDDDDDNDDEYHIPPLKNSYNRFRSPLHVAICEGSVENTRILIEQQKLSNSNTVHTYVNTHDEIGFLPLHLAACLSKTDDRNTSVDMTHLLLLSGAQADCLDSYGNTPLHWAARAGHADVVQVLLLKNCPLGEIISEIQNLIFSSFIVMLTFYIVL